ncbi:MAG: hypothetical protein ACR2HX_20185 [Pyrinomonadaceae bacterium]
MNLSTPVRPALLLATVVYLLAVFPCLQPVSAKDSWVRVSSKNLVLVGNANEKEIKQVGVRLEQFREIVSRLFAGANFKSSVPTTVIVFKSDKSYRPFKPTPNVAGYFQSGSDVNYITLTTESRGTERKPFNIIFHEYTHLLVNATSINVPTWFNEGLAEYYSTFSIADDQKVVLGRPIAGAQVRERVQPENDVVINYVPAADTRTRIDGVAKSIEFVPSDFKLKTEP